MAGLTTDKAKGGGVAMGQPYATNRPERMEPLMSALRRRFTVAEYHQLMDSGIFGEDDRVELIGGDLVMMSPIGTRHAATVKRTNRILGRLFQDRALIGVQDPLQLDDLSEPQPDLTILTPREDDYAASHPTAAEVLLIIEVSDSTADYDRDVKVRAYANAGIIETWLADLSMDWLEVYREPSPAGYKLLRKALPGETISPLAFPDVMIAVGDVIR
ncbi:MAG: Uma2 family endonuclease [Anaerolineae bacterium]|jgi:Uma2 family endonuclease|nr:Uma2 family endonuclease [Anaerolineae bacterium]